MFYDIFANLCSQNKVSPSAVVKAIGLNKSSATYWKKGTTPSSDTLQKLADYFGVSVDYLLGKEELQNDDEDMESYLDKIAGEHKLSKWEREILEMFLGLDAPARSAFLTFLNRLVEAWRNKPAKQANPMDIDSQLEMCRRGMLMGIATAQANYSLPPEDFDVDSVILTPELNAMIEDELQKCRRILEAEQRNSDTDHPAAE